MLLRAPFFRRWIAAVLLLVAAAHATLPDQPALARAPGSAFSATTPDVAVACAGPAEALRQALPDRSRPPPPTCAPLVEAPILTAATVAVPYRQLARAPPPNHVSLTPLKARAPPFV